MVDRTLYISGQLGMDPKTMDFVEGGVEEQAIQAQYIFQGSNTQPDGTLFFLIFTYLRGRSH